jgi:hypothetical protein
MLGVVLIAQMRVSPVAKVPAALLWLAFSVYEARCYAQAANSVRRLRLCADGSAVARLADGRWRRVRLLPGSIVLRRVAWLRIRLPSGLDYGELLSGSSRSDPDWHRLQLIWRQNQAAFGRPQRN